MVISLSFPFLSGVSGYSVLYLTLTSDLTVGRGGHGGHNFRERINYISCYRFPLPLLPISSACSTLLCLPYCGRLALNPYFIYPFFFRHSSSFYSLHFFSFLLSFWNVQKQLSGGMLLQQAHTQPQGREAPLTHSCTIHLRCLTTFLTAKL